MVWNRKSSWSIAVLAALTTSAFADTPGDADGDGDVDFDDFALLALCQFGPDIPSIPVCQEFYDADFDGDLDIRDVGAFQRCFSGASLPAFPDCAPHTVRLDGDCLHVIGTTASSNLALRLRAAQPSVLEIDVGNDGSIEFGFDRSLFTCIVIDARGGDDQILIDETNGVFTDTEATTVRGGVGDDTLTGGSGPETFDGGPGEDVAQLGGGSDVFIWDFGGESDFVEGGDGIDTVRINGSNAAEAFTVTANGTRVRFDRLNPVPFALDIGACEQLVLSANGGNDNLACTGNLAALIQITADGGAGDDTLLGSNGADVLLGGDDDDFIDGNQGADIALLGAGDDTFQWDPGDGSDAVEGQAGHDIVTFNGSNAAEIFEFAANGARLRFTRNIGNIVIDGEDVEQFDLRTLGSADAVTVNSLSGTDVTAINVELAGTIGGGGGDAQPDSVIVNATSESDTLTVAGSGTAATLAGMTAILNITSAEAALDRITINALGGDDVVSASGLAAGVVALTLNGGLGDDELLGSAGGDQLNGDDDNDTITGGPGGDTVLLGAGADAFIWSPGDETDLVEGGDGVDTVEINGADESEAFTTTANGTRVRFDRISPVPFALDIGTCEQLVLNANAGDDSLACTGNLAALIRITADGGAGDDTLLGSNGADLLLGGDDNDFIDGNQGLDVAFLGSGDDTFQWDPGDGNDTIEGQAGHDTVRFNGSAGSEVFEFSANGARLRFTRNLGNIVLDADAVEEFDLRTLASTDAVTVNSLVGTSLGLIHIDLAGTLGGASGDAAADAITINGTNGADTIEVRSTGGAVEVSGLSALVRVTRPESATDTLTINGLGGADTITPDAGVPLLIGLIANP